MKKLCRLYEDYVVYHKLLSLLSVYLCYVLTILIGLPKVTTDWRMLLGIIGSCRGPLAARETTKQIQDWTFRYIMQREFVERFTILLNPHNWAVLYNGHPSKTRAFVLPFYSRYKKVCNLLCLLSKRGTSDKQRKNNQYQRDQRRRIR